jgi:hypothetical protein
MSAGLPALGLGGAFYLLLIIWMIIRGCVEARHRCVPWAFIGKMTLMGGIMVAAVLGEWLVIRKAIELAGAYIPSVTSSALPTPSFSLILLFYSVPFFLLALVLLSLRILRLSTNHERMNATIAALEFVSADKLQAEG